MSLKLIRIDGDKNMSQCIDGTRNHGTRLNDLGMHVAREGMEENRELKRK